MARPPKCGLSYFPIDTGFFDDSKTLEIMDACGAQSISVLIYLLCNIYEKEGYYIRWDNGQSLLTARNLGIKRGAVQEVVDKATQVGFFDSGIYEEFEILTSAGIQRRYYEAISNFRRKGLTVRREIILFPQLSEFMQAETPVNAAETRVNACNNPTEKRREDKRREDEIRQDEMRAVKAETAPAPVPFLADEIKQEAESLLGVVSSTDYQTLCSFSKLYQKEWVLSALRIAKERGRPTLQYTRGILQSWAKQGAMDAPPERKERKARRDKSAEEIMNEYIAAMNEGRQG